MAPGPLRIAGKSSPRGVQDHLDELALIFCLSYLRFGNFWVDFGTNLVDVGTLFK